MDIEEVKNIVEIESQKRNKEMSNENVESKVESTQTGCHNVYLDTYQSAIDNSLWIYNGTSYVTYTAPASTAWFTAGTTNDAGSSKTSNIYRSGNVGIGTSTAPSALLHLQTSSQAKMLFETTNSASGQASIDLKSALNQHWRIIGQGSLNGGRFEIFNQGGSSSAFNITPSNNVGIGTITPLTLFSNAASGTNFVSSNNSTQGATGISWLTNTN
jgi:hypothetical protein